MFNKSTTLAEDFKKVNEIHKTLEREYVKIIDEDSYTNKKSKAFGDKNTDYYKLKYSIGSIRCGTIFYHDKEDCVRGSIRHGCLKICWTETGNCQCGLCADTIVFHASLKDDTNIFEKVEKTILEKEVKTDIEKLYKKYCK